MTEIFDSRNCTLGEGPLWHPERHQLFWFDILGKRLLSRHDGQELSWQFDRHVSAAGWVDADRLMIASDNALMVLDLATGEVDHLADLEADKPNTRSNDGRADPFGGFWIGTMGLRAEPGAGAIYRYYRGRIERMFSDITITNAICFAPDGKTAYFADTALQKIFVQPLDDEGWPMGASRTFLDLSDSQRNPDGAVVDSEGCLWVASWGTSEVIRVTPQGEIVQSVAIPARQPSCPAFGGDDLASLFVTSAAVDLTDPTTSDGCTFRAAPGVMGQREHQVILGSQPG